MTLDVIVPTLNAADHLPGALAALGHDYNVIVCDGGSRDGTVAIARAAGATVVVAEAGRGRQLATGAAAATAPWLLFLHADTILSDRWSVAAQGFMATNAENAAYFRLRFASTDPRARRVERLANWRSRTLGLPYGDQGLLIARDFYRRIGGFRPLPLMEDVDLVRRIGRHRLVALEADAVTSARRYELDGWLARPLRNLTCLSLYFAGFPPPLLRRLYGS